MQRRTMLQLLAGGAVGFTFRRAFAAGAAAPTSEYFVFIHAGGGWDITLWADPRNERRGLIEPASSANTDMSRIKLWKDHALDGGVRTFDILDGRPEMRLGPAIGDLYDLRDRLTIVNGLAMNTVSHDDGTVYSSTGRHRVGGSALQPSVDVMVASELGKSSLMPDVSLRFPSFFVGANLDGHAIPLRVSGVDALTRSFERSTAYVTANDRDLVAAALVDEAHELGYSDLADEHAALPQLLHGGFADALSSRTLRAAYPSLTANRAHAASAMSAAFAVESFRRDAARCVSFGFTGLDTHTQNYREHAFTLQEGFGVIAALVKQLDATAHPHIAGAKLGDHTHILVISEFCRAPHINLAGGRDHHPNNSALVISPRFRAGRTFGATDPDQLLPKAYSGFTGGERALAPQDLLATFIGAFGIDPRRFMRDGDVVRSLLA